jgi:hypothetical protein
MKQKQIKKPKGVKPKMRKHKLRCGENLQEAQNKKALNKGA